jgi:hypothetical protein
MWRKPGLYALFPAAFMPVAVETAAFAALVTLDRPKYRNAQSGIECQ